MSAPLAAARAELSAPALAPLSRRAGALLLDLAVAVVALQLIAPPVYVATGGRAQLLNAPLGAWRCETISASSSETARAIGPRACRRTLLGFPFASAMNGGAGGGAGGEARRMSGEIDAVGRPVSAIDLGWLLAPLFVAVRLWFEAFGMRTPGRALFRQRLADASGAPAASLTAMLRRYGALIAPFLIAFGGAGALAQMAPGLAGAASGLAGLAVFVIYGGAALATARGRRPYHDRFGPTAVVEARA